MDADDFFNLNKLKKVCHFFKQNNNLNSVFDFPICRKDQFSFRIKKDDLSIWPSIFPTSCISTRREFFKRFIKHIKKNNFQNLEIDARLIIFSKFYYDEYNTLKSKLTIYNFDSQGITSKVSYFSKNWWLRRKQAFSYMSYILKLKNKKIKKGYDFYLTSIISFFLKKLS